MVANSFITSRVELAAIEFLPKALVIAAGSIFRLAKHAMVLALNIVDVVTHHAEEIFVGIEDVAGHVEFDHGLGLADGSDLAFVLGILELAVGDHGSELDHLVGLAVVVDDGVVRRADPDFATTLADALVVATVEFTAAQLVPQGFVGAGLHVFGIAKHGMVLTLDFVQRVAYRRQEIFVGVQDGAVQVEFDQRLHTVERGINRLQILFAGVNHLGMRVHNCPVIFGENYFKVNI